VKWLLNDSPHAKHPSDDRLSGIYGTIVVDELGTTDDGSLHQRNVTIFADGEVDRSPCGSGSAARVAVLDARGDLAPGQALVHDSIVGSTFTCTVVESLTANGHPAVIPQITGMAYRCGTSEFSFDPRDPFVPGFVLR
jgi:proline racemase